MVRSRRPLASSVMPLDNDDLLREILLLLPPRPSSLLRASVVCKRWHRLVSDPGFLGRFRAHHGKPPVLGFFCANAYTGYYFSPTLDPPDRIPAAQFSLPQRHGESLDFAECRHGLVLFLNKELPEAVAWNPISGRQRRVSVPPQFDNTGKRGIIYVAVLCAAGDDEHGHVHGDCDLDYFKLALVHMGVEDHRHVSICLPLRIQVWCVGKYYLNTDHRRIGFSGKAQRPCRECTLLVALWRN
ncbi:uncharacterized protein [Triticum aestivum]|uniref:uncharacterized protein n=1 Tax=Triticum aestivum TaxID=4565 RepID=UPI001D00D299|nr:uncharacterized protein LOC123116541 [Triticum aestivum]